MNILVNNEPLNIKDSLSLKDFFSLQYPGAAGGVAIAVNGKVIPFSQWEKYFINENDNLLVVQATQGG